MSLARQQAPHSAVFIAFNRFLEELSNARTWEADFSLLFTRLSNQIDFRK